MNLLRACQLNWFLYIEVFKEKLSGYSQAAIEQIILDFSGQLHMFNLSENEDSVLEQSRQAYLLSQRLAENEIAGDDNIIHCENEEDGLAMGHINDPLQPEARDIIEKKVKHIRARSKRKAARLIAEKKVFE